VLGFFMSLGKAAVYKHIPVYYPNHVGAVGGVVGWSAASAASSCRSPSAR
jgi:nitrate/nitrite transporter NarK